MDLKFREIEVLHAVLQSGSTVAAAEMLAISQPAVSMTLKAAEERFGFQLFHRKGVRLEPTELLNQLRPLLRQLFGAWGDLEREIRALGEHEPQQISVAAPQPLVSAFLSSAVAGFQARNPEVRIVILSVPIAIVRQMVQDGLVDFGIVYEDGETPFTEQMLIATSAVACVLSQRHVLAGKAALGPHDLAHEKLYSYRQGTALARRIAATFAACHVSLDLKVQTNSLSASQLAISEGGVALVDPLVLRPGALQDAVVLRFEPHTAAPIQLLRRANARLGGKARALQSHLGAVTKSMVEQRRADYRL